MWPTHSVIGARKRCTTASTGPSQCFEPSWSEPGLRRATCELQTSNAAGLVRITGAMLQLTGKTGRVSCPTPESLVPHALSMADVADQIIARHLEGCPMCQAQRAEIQKAAGSLQVVRSLERLTETPECLEEPLIADFVEGRLSPEARAPLIAHLLTCARCRSIVAATGRLLGDKAVARE